MDNRRSFYWGGVGALAVYALTVTLFVALLLRHHHAVVPDGGEVSVDLSGSFVGEPEPITRTLPQPDVHPAATPPRPQAEKPVVLPVPSVRAPSVDGIVRKIDLAALQHPVKPIVLPTMGVPDHNTSQPKTPRVSAAAIASSLALRKNALAVSAKGSGSKSGLGRLAGMLSSQWSPQASDAGRQVAVGVTMNPGGSIEYSLVRASGSASFDARVLNLLAQIRQQHPDLGDEPIDAVLTFKAKD